MSDWPLTLQANSWPVSFVILGIVLILRYLMLSGFFYLICKWKKLAPIGHQIPLGKQIKRDIFWSIISSLIFAAAGSILLFLYQNNKTLIYVDLMQYPLWYIPVSLFLFMTIQDTYFYWSHRLLHLFKYKSCHHVHHESRAPTAWTSFAFHPLEAFIQAIILPILVVIIPIHFSAFILFLMLMSLFGVMNHLGHELYPPFLEKYIGLINATHHQLHHRRVNHNFGLFFNWWDRLMHTEWSGK